MSIVAVTAVAGWCLLGGSANDEVGQAKANKKSKSEKKKEKLAKK